MKAIVLRHPGGPTALSYEDAPMPKVKEGWTLLKVKGFGINRSEIFTRNGWSPSVKLPRILGIECVGEVVETTDPERLQKVKLWFRLWVAWAERLTAVMQNILYCPMTISTRLTLSLPFKIWQPCQRPMARHMGHCSSCTLMKLIHCSFVGQPVASALLPAN